MKQEDKELLLKDLAARLPHGVCVHIRYKGGEPCYGKLTSKDIQWFIDSNIKVIKPYLRPLSSMTEEDNLSLSKYVGCSIRANYGEIYFPNIEDNTLGNWEKIFDWLNAHHFDYRTNDEGKTLIKKSLAIRVTENNNPYKDYECNIRQISKES